MTSDTSIKDIMTKNVVTVSSSDTLWDVERVFRINHLRHAPVYDNNEVVGMISLVDLRKSFPIEEEGRTANQDDSDMIAAHIMAIDPVTLQHDQTIREAAILLSENEFHAVPVLDGEDLVGIISTTDIIRFLIDALDEMEEV